MACPDLYWVSINSAKGETRTENQSRFNIPFSKASAREPMVVDSLAKISNFLNVTAQQRKSVRLTVCPQLTQHRVWTGALEEILNSMKVDLDLLTARGSSTSTLMGEQIVHNCWKFLTETAPSSDPETASWMKLTPSKPLDPSNPHKWEDILEMFNDLIEYFRSETMLKLHVTKLEVMKEALSQIKDVIVDDSIGYKEARHQESLVQKKLTKTLGHSSRCLFTLLLYYLYRRVSDIEVDIRGGVYENGSKDRFCLSMGRILTSDDEKMIGRGVKQLDQALGVFKYVWETAKMKGNLDLDGVLERKTGCSAIEGTGTSSMELPFEKINTGLPYLAYCFCGDSLITGYQKNDGTPE